MHTSPQASPLGCQQHSANLHLICGPVAAGKSTYAKQLADATGGIVLSMDEWMSDLFLQDLPADTSLANLDYAWFASRVDRCEANMWRLSEQLLSRYRSVVLDWGFIRLERRDKARCHAASLGQAVQLHYVTADAEIRRQRVLARNQQKGSSYAFAVTPEMFAFAEQLFEPPTGAELRTLHHVQG